MPFPRTTVFDRIVQARFRGGESSKEMDFATRTPLLPLARRRRRSRILSKQLLPLYWTGVHRGQYYRIRIPKNHHNKPTTQKAEEPLITPLLPSIPKLHTPTSAPLQLKNTIQQVEGEVVFTTNKTTNASVDITTSGCTSAIHTTSTTTTTTTNGISMWERFVLWLRENASTLVLNFGSICTLFGFTRSDVLELRALSVTGSICGMFYHFTLRPLRYPPLFWSALFAFVNGYKILEIVQERQGNVRLTQQQEQRYIHFFMPHGITPKQFEIIDAKAEILEYKKGQIIIRRDEELNHVYLVVQGTTRASILGRFLTAASFRHHNNNNNNPESNEQRTGAGGGGQQTSNSSSSGAWIGEISLLERVWLKEQGKLNVKTTKSQSKSTTTTQPSSQSKQTQKSDANATSTTTNNNKDTTTTTSTNPQQQNHQQQQLQSNRSMYTIVAQEDCTVLRWSHADMEQLMEKSSDMRAGLTRAMTAAIVGKVINFTVSRQNAAKLPTWSTWLDDWKSSGAQVVQVQVENNNNNPTTTSNPTTAEETITTPKENLPLYPIRRFR